MSDIKLTLSEALLLNKALVNSAIGVKDGPLADAIGKLQDSINSKTNTLEAQVIDLLPGAEVCSYLGDVSVNLDEAEVLFVPYPDLNVSCTLTFCLDELGGYSATGAGASAAQAFYSSIAEAREEISGWLEIVESLEKRAELGG